MEGKRMPRAGRAIKFGNSKASASRIHACWEGDALAGFGGCRRPDCFSYSLSQATAVQNGSRKFAGIPANPNAHRRIAGAGAEFHDRHTVTRAINGSATVTRAISHIATFTRIHRSR